MTSPLRRRALLTSALLTSGALIGASATFPAAAGEVRSPATCKSAALEGQTLDLDFTVNITPTTAYVGRTVTPKMVVKATIPGNIVGLAAFFGVKSASATGTFKVGSGGVVSPRPFVFPRTDIPQSATPYTATINLALLPVKRTAIGSVTYKPGNVDISLTGYNKKKADAAPGDDVGTVDADCTSKAPNQTIGSVTFVKSPTALASSVGYAKAAKKVTAVSRVTARSGVTPYGKVTSVLYKGTTKVRTLVATLSAGKATAVFTGVRAKGSYKVVSTYSGSPAHKTSKQTRFFAIR